MLFVTCCDFGVCLICFGLLIRVVLVWLSWLVLIWGFADVDLVFPCCDCCCSVVQLNWFFAIWLICLKLCVGVGSFGIAYCLFVFQLCLTFLGFVLLVVDLCLVAGVFCVRFGVWF